ncbi:MAG TPA: hypothetical protein VJP76_07845 [Candidatus Tumulicola sp.]|nr:hypothetical protein [Candidatus Tumulicola sp.]
MLRTIACATLAFGLASSAAGAAATCTGADPAITEVGIAGVTPAGGVDQYHVAGTVVNRGSQNQASNVLQFVDILQNGQRLDSKSVPPLAAGQSFTFTYVALRSTEAGKGTTTLHFQLRMRQPSPGGSENCSTDDDGNSVTF